MPSRPPGPAWTAIVLAGGSGRRLGGADKAALTLGGVTALDRLLAHLPSTAPVIVSGPRRATSRMVRFVVEDPPGGGPVAGIAAAVAAVDTAIVVLLATDMPWAGTLATALVHEYDPQRAGILVPLDATGRRQPLCSVASTDALRAALADLGDPSGRSMTALLSHLTVEERALDVEEDRSLDDIDTPADLSMARQRLAAPTLGIDRNDPQRGAAVMEEWIDAVRIELELDSAVDIDVLLDVARVAAHSVARPAAPITTFLLGVAVAGGADLASAARKIEALAEGWAKPE
jgi:molybdopterin-guanine dinucleotide biosynthesis protein A